MFVIMSLVMLIITLAFAGIGLPMGTVFWRLMPGAMAALQSGVQRFLPAWVWIDICAPLLTLPIWVIPGFFTLFFAMVAAAAAITPRLRHGVTLTRVG